MATLPQSVTQSQTVTAIYSWWEGKLQWRSQRLGASSVGEECERRSWYMFRWAGDGGKMDGRGLRLFNRGHREEAIFIEELRGIGVQVFDLDPTTGKQFKFFAHGGHFVAKIDGVGVGIPEAPKIYHVLSFKTSNTKNFAKLVKDGVQKSKPENWAQSQVEMRLASLERTLYLSVNKDDDSLYAERIKHDEAESQRLLEKAERIIFAQEPPGGISSDPAFYKCKFCPASVVCHGQKLAAVSCRTCLHSTPEREGDGRWSCAKWKADEIPLDAQRDGCEEHRYIPALLSKWGEAVDANESERWVEYRAADGYSFRNGPWGLNSFTSKELAASTPALLRDSEFQRIRAEYAGVIVDRESEAFEEAA